MKRSQIYIIVGLLFSAAFLEAGWTVENSTNLGVPVSAQSQGLIRSPNPIDRSSDLSVTGNIRGGKYFRGVLPYRAPTYFGQTTPSSSIDSFLRDSAGSEDFGRYTGRYQPYYSPTQTVTKITPGSSNVTRPPTMNIGGYGTKTPIFGTLPSRTDSMLNPKVAIPLRSLRPMSMTPQELEEQISSEIDAYQQPKIPADQQNDVLIEKFRHNIEQTREKTAGLSKNLTTKSIPSLPSITRKPLGYILQRTEIPTKKEEQSDEYEERLKTPFTAAGEPNEQMEEMDVYAQMKLQLDELQQRIELALATQQTEDAASSPPSEGPQTTISESDRISADEQTQENSSYQKLAKVDLSVAAKAKDILGSYETFSSFSEDKFNQHMQVAELYLKQGRYYRAADAYTLASIYKPDDPLAYAGKSHALFASGEYMSSALFLSRALQIFPEYAQFEIDIEAMVGDKDELETRVVDVEEWLQNSNDAPELNFLLAYIHHQMGKPQKAKEAINAAYEKMPEAPGVLALKKAIEDSL